MLVEILNNFEIIRGYQYLLLDRFFCDARGVADSDHGRNDGRRGIVDPP
jgi:hypothetical protein